MVSVGSREFQAYVAFKFWYIILNPLILLVQGELYNLPDGLTRPASITQQPTLPIPVWVPCAAYSVRQFQYAFFLELPIEILWMNYISKTYSRFNHMKFYSNT